MAFDAGAILELPGAIRSAISVGRALGTVPSLSEMRPFTLALVGPVDGGKTALVRSLLQGPLCDVAALAERPGPDTLSPVEYVPGAQLRLLLGLGGTANRPQRWVEASLDDSEVLRGPGLSWVRVETPSPILAQWNVRFVDYPSIEVADELVHERYSALSSPDTGILYVVPGRGLTDADAQALELLRRQRVAVVENIREDELLPTRSLLQAVEVPGLSCPFVVPVLAFRARGAKREQGERERALLRSCAALLRADSIPPGQLGQRREEVRRARADVRAGLGARLDALYDVRNAESSDDRLRAVLSAVSLERDAGALESLDTSLTQLMACFERSDAVTPSVRRELLRKDVEAVIDAYNVEAGTRSVARGGVPSGRILDFGARYVEAREELTGFLTNILEHDELEMMTQAERESVARLISEVGSDRIEVALLGRFSSGKSSLINALLGVPVDDRAPTLLPTSVRPETATVNRLEYAQGAVLRDVSWLERASLTFLSETTEPGQLRVHTDEIKAFHSWLRSGSVRVNQCSFDFVGTESRTKALVGSRGGPRDPLRAFDALWRSLKFPEHPSRFVYSQRDWRTPKLPGGECPARVEIRRFERPVPGWPKAPTLRQAFDAVKSDPAVALRVGCLHVGFEHPLLEHASIIDTPGTDAPIPHHRKVAREIIKDKGCPVLYCFLGTRAGGREDRENLRQLKEWGIGKTDLTRFFFVITMKGLVPDADHDEVRGAVKGSLAEVGIPSSQIYFTEVVREQNSEFQALKDDVSKFVAQSRGPLFSSWVASARRILGDVHGRYERRLLALAEDEKTRAARLGQLEAEGQTLSAIAAEFECSRDWGVQWATARISDIVSKKAEEIDELIAGLTTRESFEGIEDALGPAIEDLNDAAKRAVRAVTEGMSGKLKSCLAERLQGRTIDVRPLLLEDDFFQSAGLLEAVEGLEWRGFGKKLWQWFGGADWNRDAGVNRGRIASPWAASRTAGEAALEAQLTSTLEHLRQELRRIKQAIESELDICSVREPPEAAEVLRKRRAHASAWLRRFDALERKFQGGPRK